jgi:hypothetical protein
MKNSTPLKAPGSAGLQRRAGERLRPQLDRYRPGLTRRHYRDNSFTKGYSSISQPRLETADSPLFVWTQTSTPAHVIHSSSSMREPLPGE